jgi:peptide/nickel transport system substrate-binding protein
MRLKAAALICAVLMTLSACGGSDSKGGGGGDAADAGQLELVPAEVQADAPKDVAKGTRYVITVNIKPGIKWSDGSPLAARDFLGIYDVKWAQQDSIWEELTDVKAPSDTELVFETNTLSPNLLQNLLRWNQTSAWSEYGEVYRRAADLRAQGLKQTDPKVAALVRDAEKMEFSGALGYGPYTVDPKSVTAQQFQMVKNPGGYNADKLTFDHVEVVWGSNQQTIPLLLKNELDYTTDALTPSDVRAVEANPNIELIRTPLSTGTGIWFNESTRPFDDKRFRQAIAYLIDRERNAKVSLGTAAKPIRYMVGFSDNFVPDWLSDDVVGNLNSYDREEAAATRLLEEVGLSKDGDGWSYEGRPFGFEIIAPADFPDFLASAKDVSAQLNEFGFDTHVRGIPAANRPDTIAQGRYKVMLDFSMVSAPAHPASIGTWPQASSARTTRRATGLTASTGRGTRRPPTAPTSTSPTCSERRSRASRRSRSRDPWRRWRRSSTTNCRSCRSSSATRPTRSRTVRA